MQTDPQSPAQPLMIPADPSQNPAPVTPVVWRPTAAQQAFYDSLESLPIREQFETVRKKLLEVHPDNETSTISYRVNTSTEPELRIYLRTDRVDLWPVRGLKTLKILYCPDPDFAYPHTEWTPARQLDLAPLQGMSLGQLHLNGRKITDLRPLQGMPLKTLSLAGCQISDLEPLRDLPLTEINLFRTPVTDLTPLTKMPLEKLFATYTHINDLSPLRGSPLRHLDLGGTKIEDLQPLAGLPLESLVLTYTKVMDISPLKTLPLEKLHLNNTQVSDLSPLHGRPLKVLAIQKTPVSDLSVLKNFPLETLLCNEPLLEANKNLLAEIQTLRKVNNQPAEELFSVPAVWTPSPAQQAFFDEVAQLSAKQQFEAVRKKLLEANPGISEPKFSHQVKDNQVFRLELYFEAEYLDLWPIRALSHLQELVCNVAGYHPGSSRRHNWEPRGVRTLGPLTGLPLRSLNLRGNAVADLSSLKEMPLKNLDLSGSNVTDLSPLSELSLERLILFLTPVADLSPLSQMPLKVLSIPYSEVSDFSPLQGLSLVSLDCGSCKVTDLSPLSGMPLNHLHMGSIPATDLSPLKGMPLITLNLSGAAVTDLSPLKETKIGLLDLGSSKCTDWESLKEMEVRRLVLGSIFPDLSFLRGKQLDDLWCYLRLFDPDNEAVLRSLSLKVLGMQSGTTQSADEFWKNYEARQADALAFGKTTAGQPVAVQVAAVREKLTQLNDGKIGELEYETEDNVVSQVTLTLGTSVNDLSPLLAFSDLKHLTLRNRGYFDDLSALTLLPVESLNCDTRTIESNAFVLQQASSLRTINGKPAEELLASLLTNTR